MKNIMNEKKQSRFTWKKFFGHAFIAFTLFHVDIYMNTIAFAEDNNINVVDKQKLAQQNANENKAHEENTFKADSTSSCRKSGSSVTDRENAENHMRNDLINQSFSEMDQVFVDVENSRQALDGNSSNLSATTGGIGLQGAGQNSNITDRKKLEEEQRRLRSEVPAAKSKVSSLQAQLNSCIYDGDGQRTRQCKDYKRISANLAIAQQELNKLELRQRQIKSDIWNTTVNKGGAAVGDADAAVDRSHQASSSTEANYERMLELIKAQESRMDAAMQTALARLEAVELEEKHNAEFKIYEKAMADFDETTAHGKRALSNLEVMSMASAALQLLNCRDISDIKTRSYPLLKAASANFIASTINDTEAYTDVTKNCIMQCESIDSIKADQKTGSELFPQFAKKDLTNVVSNCKAANGSDGLLVNDANADDDKNEQIKSIERAANLHNELVKAGELLIANRENSISMFRAAHAAALMELTTKTSRVAAAEAQLAQAKAWKAKAQNSILIYIAIVAALASASAACWGCLAAAVAAAVIILLWHRKDKKKAERKIAKWKKKLQEARIHGHMACNYPGANAGIDESITPMNVPLIYPKSTIDRQVTASVDFKDINNNEAIASSIEDVMFMKGEISSLPYNQIIPTMDDTKDFFDKIGFRIKNKSEKAADVFSEFLFPNVNAKSSTNALGLHTQSTSFKYYMSMRVGAWKLLTFNASLLVDLRKPMVTIDHLHPRAPVGTSIREHIKRNSSEFAGKTIQKTGFALPETRMVIMQAILEMIQANLGELGTGLTAATDMRDKYVTLLNQMRESMGLGTTGVEDDLAKQEERGRGVCMKKDSSGEYSVDSSCQCAKNNSCANFKSPKFANFTPGAVSTSATLAVDQANARMNGNLKEANLAAGKLNDQSNAVSNFINKEGNKLNKLRKDKGLPPRNFSEEGKLIVSAKREKFKADLAKSSPDLAALAKGSMFSSLDDNKTGTDSSSKDDANIANQNVISLASKGKARGGNKRGSSNLDIGLGSIDLGEGDELGSLDLNRIHNENSYQGHQRSNSGSSMGGSRGSDTFIGADGTKWKYSQGISRDRKSSIFRIISRRYKKSALPKLVVKKRK